MLSKGAVANNISVKHLLVFYIGFTRLKWTYWRINCIIRKNGEFGRFLVSVVWWYYVMDAKVHTCLKVFEPTKEWSECFVMMYLYIKLDWRDLNVVLGHLSPFPIANRGFSSLGWMHWTELFNDSINLETFQCTFYFFLMVISHEWRRLV